MSDWNPIETAPRDGTHILAYCPLNGVAVIFWRSFGWPDKPEAGSWDTNGASGYECESEMEKATHWMSLPPLPDGD